ncbi:hypothetical protein RIF29_05265 [Crotalaria pallida]|uniref:Uncharacterized protein n=1 Tax=Crotalaria pallida TaxID=3830 RepID=A0AAN9PA87_CROPI
MVRTKNTAHQSPPPPPHHSPTVVAELEPEPEPEPEASSDLSPDRSKTSSSSDSSTASLPPLAVAPQASLDSNSSFDLSDLDDNESTSSSEEDKHEGVWQAVEDEVQEPQQPQGEQHIRDVLDRYRDSLKRILEMALSMHQSGILDLHIIQQIVAISSRPMGHVVAAAALGGHVPQRGG